MNHVCLIGRLTRDPDVYKDKDGSIKAAFYSLACESRFRPRGSNDRATDFVPVVCFSHDAEFAMKYLRKGMKIGITGKIRSGTYKKQNGDVVRSLEVIAETQEFCSEKKAGEERQQIEPKEGRISEQASQNVSDEFVDISEEGMPFN